MPASPVSARSNGSPRGERHDHDGHPAHDPDTLLDAWVRELTPLTGEQRRALALLLNSLAPVPARPAGLAAELDALAGLGQDLSCRSLSSSRYIRNASSEN
jgi:hypothetical protein